MPEPLAQPRITVSAPRVSAGPAQPTNLTTESAGRVLSAGGCDAWTSEGEDRSVCRLAQAGTRVYVYPARPASKARCFEPASIRRTAIHPAGCLFILKSRRRDGRRADDFASDSSSSLSGRVPPFASSQRNLPCTRPVSRRQTQTADPASRKVASRHCTRRHSGLLPVVLPAYAEQEEEQCLPAELRLRRCRHPRRFRYQSWLAKTVCYDKRRSYAKKIAKNLFGFCSTRTPICNLAEKG